MEFPKRVHFKELPYTARILSHYKVVVRKGSRHLYPNEIKQMELLELSAPIIKMKVKVAWENREASHPKIGRAGYQADLK